MAKRLYLLERATRDYDTTFEMVVRATTGRGARKIASDDCSSPDDKKVWLDPEKSTCKILRPERGKLGVIIKHFIAG